MKWLQGTHARFLAIRSSRCAIYYLGYRRPDQLSGGQQQRVAMARALAMNPKIVLADEPTANVDSHTGKELVDLMRGLSRRFGTIFVIASHDQAVIEAADRLVRIEDGRMTGPGVVYKRRKPAALICPRRRRSLRERLHLVLRRIWRMGGQKKED